MQTMTSFDPKPLGATQVYGFDFISQLAVGETILTEVVAATVYSGTDATPSAIIGAVTSSGTQVAQVITGGTLGVVYKLLCTITTSGGQTLQQAGLLAVVPDVV